MEASPKQQENHSPQHTQSLLPSPNSHSCTSSSNSTTSNNTTTITTTTHNALQHCNQPPPPPLPSPKPITRSESTNPYPTTFVQADTSSFKQVVQMLTGSPKPTNTNANSNSSQPDPSPKSHNIPPIKSIPKKTQSSSSGFKLYERRNSLKNLKINPLNPIFSSNNSGFSPRKPEILSPSILDFPALVLSPVTPLIPDPFDRSGSQNYNNTNCYNHNIININNHPVNNNNNNNNNTCVNGNLLDTDAEEKAIKERGFFLHPSPASTPREAEPPRLLPLFPVTSPRVSGSANPSS